jgi:hypothetical protein
VLERLPRRPMVCLPKQIGEGICMRKQIVLPPVVRSVLRVVGISVALILMIGILCAMTLR